MNEIVVVGRKPSTPWKIGLGTLLVLAAVANSSRPATDGAAGALGDLVGISILLFGGAALIGSGLAKNLGNQPFMKARRRLWYRLLAAGFVVMAIASFGLMALGLGQLAVLVLWFYWFVWTWVSWKIADGKTVEKMRTRVQT